MRAATAILLTLSVSPTNGERSDTRPKIVLIVSDDVGYADIGIYGSRIFQHQTSIASLKRGSASLRLRERPLLQPNPRRFMTGRYPQRFGYEFNPDGSPDCGLPLTETTMADRLKAAGYRTALFGKWHLVGRIIAPDASRIRGVLWVPRR